MLDREHHRLTRQELYDLTWTDPVYKVAARFGISGVALAKKCRKAGIPLPSRGYWAQLAHGKKVRKVPLKPAPKGVEETVIITQGDGPWPTQPPEPKLDPMIAAMIAEVRLEENRIVVPDLVERLHPEAKKMAVAANRERPWNERNAKATPLELRRRRILDAFFRSIIARRFKVESHSSTGFTVALFGSAFSLSCSDVEKRVRVPMTREELRKRSQWERRDYNIVTQRPGLLRIRIYHGQNGYGSSKTKDFTETQDAPLETFLPNVLVWLLERSISVAERDRREEEARAEQARAEVFHREAEIVRREEERRRWEAEERLRQEKARVAALLSDSEQWRRAENIRSYVAAATVKNDEWKVWALGVADEIDPLTQTNDQRR
jgi:hypothetical protein